MSDEGFLVLRTKASENPELYYLATSIAAYTNNHCHYDLMEIDDVERKALLAEMKDLFDQMLR
jgi:hypothetical protein